MLSVLLHTPTAAIKTRVSPALLAGRYVYKIAKPLDLGCVDSALALLVEPGHELTVLHIKRRYERRN
jgi:hypothetical protein